MTHDAQAYSWAEPELEAFQQHVATELEQGFLKPSPYVAAPDGATVPAVTSSRSTLTTAERPGGMTTIAAGHNIVTTDTKETCQGISIGASGSMVPSCDDLYLNCFGRSRSCVEAAPLLWHVYSRYALQV